MLCFILLVSTFKPQLEPNAKGDPVLRRGNNGLKGYLSSENVSQVDELHKNIAIFA